MTRKKAVKKVVRKTKKKVTKKTNPSKVLKYKALQKTEVSPEWESPYTQQGDCLVKKVGPEFADLFENHYSEIPKDAKPFNSQVILKGTSNNHAIVSGKGQILEHQGRIFLIPETDMILDHVKDMTTRAHAEHHAQVIPPRKAGYYVDVVMEFDHAKEESRRVVD